MCTGARAPPGGPPGPPRDPPPGGVPGGVLGGSRTPSQGPPSGGSSGGVRPPRAVRTQRAGSQDRPPPVRSMIVWSTILPRSRLPVTDVVALRWSCLIVSRVELHSMSRCMSSCIPCRVACRVAFSLWRSEDTTCPQLKPRLAGLVIANPNDVARRWWQSPPTPTLAPSCYGHELATSRSLTHA